MHIIIIRGKTCLLTAFNFNPAPYSLAPHIHAAYGKQVGLCADNRHSTCVRAAYVVCTRVPFDFTFIVRVKHEAWPKPFIGLCQVRAFPATRAAATPLLNTFLAGTLYRPKGYWKNVYIEKQRNHYSEKVAGALLPIRWTAV